MAVGMARKAKTVREGVSALRVPLAEVLKDLPWFRVSDHGKRFSEALQTPIIQSLSNLPVVDGEANIDEAINNIWSQRIEKLILLLKHYNIEETEDPWVLLSLRLACAFVPGLQVLRKPPRGAGRPKKWTSEARDKMIAAVEAVLAEKSGRSISRSIEILKKREPDVWAFLNKARYYEALRDRELRNQAMRALKPEQ
jgi:hypothetical protein